MILLHFSQQGTFLILDSCVQSDLLQSLWYDRQLYTGRSEVSFSSCARPSWCFLDLDVQSALKCLLPIPSFQRTYVVGTSVDDHHWRLVRFNKHVSEWLYTRKTKATLAYDHRHLSCSRSDTRAADMIRHVSDEGWPHYQDTWNTYMNKLWLPVLVTLTE